ncbi:MAG: hypothetical protein AXA67_00975 [Methylothermaceae bacteria B42]|nr:MAG: hypothetical protein AXA67_00975 [Methylothermaceae bacteria B42]HHJ38225.1 type II toxin-antitoxin system RelE/ParE family toxin [Methylothermaceae bacterium]
MRIKLSSTAEQQLLSGYHFYEGQSEGLGDYFLNSLMADIDSLQIYAGVHAIHFGKYHRLLAKRFPYSIYYRIENGNVLVFAVLDNRRNPEWIKDQLRADNNEQ